MAQTMQVTLTAKDRDVLLGVASLLDAFGHRPIAEALMEPFREVIEWRPDPEPTGPPVIADPHNVSPEEQAALVAYAERMRGLASGG